MKPNPRLFLSCNCCCSVLTIEKDEEFNEYHVALFKRSFNHKLSWQDRLRWIKEILLTGNIWTDNVVLDRQEFNKLKKFTNKY